ncbi:unnamed protein product [Oppiella nova]|uniref:Nuclear receptor domain-containing protein n=1 Tax=Oppiella nova TaxID=334625 RepID=A0A7R9QPE2_9ACAR|nr:unnamed protein product [Oppiella nova]CAG2170714.1 unnamed protein product [Oppiella nova]
MMTKRYQKYKCRFGDNCVITEESRKLCQKCRLKKCFAVGMKKEWILNEEEKEFRRQRIEENRKYREMCFNQTSHDVPEVDKTVNSDSNANSWDDINNQQINEYINQIENYITNDESSDKFHESIGDNIIIKPIIDGNNLDDKDICTDKIPGHTGTTNSVGTSTLVKYSFTEMQILKAALYYNHYKKCWTIETIMPILLFNPERPNIINRDMIEANGINFCVITCQSCKAFFRRNAYNFEKQKCRFGDICVINEKTRKYCIKCRLKKCFSVGMKKEWIMNEKEKQLRRTQIEKNRKFRQTISKSTTNGDKVSQTLNSDSDIDSIETLDDEKIIDYILDITNESNDQTINSCPKIKSVFTTVDELRAFSATIFHKRINNFIQLASRLSAFNSMCLNDQIAMIKYSCIEMQMLKAATFYNHDNPYWYLELVLMPILLFNPKRPGIVQKDMIELQHQLYLRGPK